MTKFPIDRLPPVSLEVRVSIQQRPQDQGKRERKQDPKPAPRDDELEPLEDEPKHQFDDLA